MNRRGFLRSLSVAAATVAVFGVHRLAVKDETWTDRETGDVWRMVDEYRDDEYVFAKVVGRFDAVRFSPRDWGRI